MRVTKEQVRAARALLGWSRPRLALESGVSVRTLARFEGGECEIRDGLVIAACKALISGGVQFIPENGGGFGVRIRRG